MTVTGGKPLDKYDAGQNWAADGVIDKERLKIWKGRGGHYSDL